MFSGKTIALVSVVLVILAVAFGVAFYLASNNQDSGSNSDSGFSSGLKEWYAEVHVTDAFGNDYTADVYSNMEMDPLNGSVTSWDIEMQIDYTSNGTLFRHQYYGRKFLAYQYNDTTLVWDLQTCYSYDNLPLDEWQEAYNITLLDDEDISREVADASSQASDMQTCSECLLYQIDMGELSFVLSVKNGIPESIFGAYDYRATVVTFEMDGSHVSFYPNPVVPAGFECQDITAPATNDTDTDCPFSLDGEDNPCEQSFCMYTNTTDTETETGASSGSGSGGGSGSDTTYNATLCEEYTLEYCVENPGDSGCQDTNRVLYEEHSRRHLSATCSSLRIGDGFCDPCLNTQASGWDGGDCCPGTCTGKRRFPCGYAGYQCKKPMLPSKRTRALRAAAVGDGYGHAHGHGHSDAHAVSPLSASTPLSANHTTRASTCVNGAQLGDPSACKKCLFLHGLGNKVGTAQWLNRPCDSTCATPVYYGSSCSCLWYSNANDNWQQIQNQGFYTVDVNNYWGSIGNQLLGNCEAIYNNHDTVNYGWDDANLQKTYYAAALQVYQNGGTVYAHSMANLILTGACMQQGLCGVRWWVVQGPLRGSKVANLGDASKTLCLGTLSNGVCSGTQIGSGRVGDMLGTTGQPLTYGQECNTWHDAIHSLTTGHTTERPARYAHDRGLLLGGVCGTSGWGSGGVWGAQMLAVNAFVYGYSTNADGALAQDECLTYLTDQQNCWESCTFWWFNCHTECAPVYAQHSNFIAYSGNHFDGTGYNGNHAGIIDWYKTKL
eukprot:TRINITY_DN2436_c0_g2::TRINITY_DN2436_c0_g2_i1::g.8891::m.8891 TRINITY_DN2436_c0_g2::TRINITY_DN2436_c0_g2_i1::g.8891  ORF type:complete len:777 (-),score=223.16,Notch/PF00066.12/1.5e+04,Notch/PF00066.12/9e-05,Notch/PF00066.12/7.4e+02,Notch/PF00066.12/5.7e+03,Notch/PF00066.12/1.1e+04,CAF1-p150_C2/PF15539.1/0.13,Serglycin/PF04360.7/97,Serglycin/PF04360.7/0.2,Serglycin/PF04360.7/1.1e+03 TRINITY_DN2436_c0_g2_i1:576-2906(-)